MADAFLALKRTVVLEGCTLRVAVRVAGGDVERIENHALLHQLFGDRYGKLAYEPSDQVSPRLLAEMKVEGFNGLFSGLMASEAGRLRPFG